MARPYATVTELVDFMRLRASVPDPTKIGEDRSKETVGQGGGTTEYFLDYGFVIDASQVITSVGGTTLTEDTDYTFDNRLGKITMLAPGTAIIGTDNFYAKYDYTKVQIESAELQAALNRATDYFENETNNLWVDGPGSASPQYEKHSNEKARGKGNNNRDYFLESYPLPDVSTTLSTAVAVNATEIIVTSTNGFPDTGIIGIGSNKITYTSKSGTTFYGGTGVVSGGSTGAGVDPFVIEISTTSSGTEPTFEVLDKDSDYDMDKESGRVHLYRDDLLLDVLTTSNPPRLIPNRFRATYLQGNNTIPEDVKEAILMIASKDVMKKAVRKAHSNGLNDFNPDLIKVDQEDIDKAIELYKLTLIEQI